MGARSAAAVSVPAAASSSGVIKRARAAAKRGDACHIREVRLMRVMRVMRGHICATTGERVVTSDATLPLTHRQHYIPAPLRSHICV